jgi:Tfp pilus assembly protein PilO
VRSFLRAGLNEKAIQVAELAIRQAQTPDVAQYWQRLLQQIPTPTP